MLLGISIRAGATTSLSAVPKHGRHPVSEVPAKELPPSAPPQYRVPHPAVGTKRRSGSTRALVGMGSAITTISASKPLGAIRGVHVESTLRG
jgi:hypothetical protein